MVVTGRTLIGDKPVAGVSIYVFHTDIQGNYSKETTDNRVGELHPSLHGALRTDAQGRYQFETIRPAGYDGGPSHVHYVVKAEGYEPLLLVLQFMDDPIAVKTLNAKRKYWDELAFREGPCKSRPDCILTQPVTIDPQNVAHVVRDIQMVRKN
jgi:protocatechuate 3,4-dioxygenase beta subunit